MTTGDDPDFRPAARFNLPARQPIGVNAIGVHTLGEFVFCPRAGWIAHESGHEAGDEEPNLGPRLDLFIDYDEHQFAEALNQAESDLRMWITLMAPAILAVVLAWRFHSPLAGAVMGVPFVILSVECGTTLMHIAALVKERRRFKDAPEEQIDLPPDETRLSWWTLRKAGFDCRPVPDALCDLDDTLRGRPWRTLRRGDVCVPVIRRPHGTEDWWPQHEVRIAAYCRLIELSHGARSPFGVILFAGTDQCAIIHNTAGRQAHCDQALARAVASLGQRASEDPHIPAAPTDGRCHGCQHGKPRRFRQGKSETVLNGKPIPACVRERPHQSDKRRVVYHSDCGDRFKWAPSHKDAINLGIASDV